MDFSHNSHNKAAKLERRDRLSELPDSLILMILSFLRMEDVVRTTILSKRWEDLWTTIPCLDFHFVNSSFIEWALAKRKGAKILKFSITLWDNYPPSDLLDSWLLLPLIKQVEHLSIDLLNIDPEYCPPQPFYSCSSITKLYLSFCNLKTEDNVNVQWNHLKSLLIDGVDYMSADAMNRILSGAPLLEELILLSLDITENFNIQSTSLKKLKICMYVYNVGDFEGNAPLLKICTPNLESLEISGQLHTRCFLSVPSLTNATLGVDDFYYRRVLNEASRNLLREEMFRQAFLSLSHVEELTLDECSSQLLVGEIKKDNYVLFPKLVMLNIEQFWYKYCDDYHSLTPKSIFPNLSLLQYLRQL